MGEHVHRKVYKFNGTQVREYNFFVKTASHGTMTLTEDLEGGK